MIDKFFDDFGSDPAGVPTYYAVVSLFPLLLLASTILGFVLAGNQRLQHEALTSALAEFPVIGEELGQRKHLSGGTTGPVVGILGALYGGSGWPRPSSTRRTRCGRSRATTGRTAEGPRPSVVLLGTADWPCSPRPACPSWAAVARGRSGKRPRPRADGIGAHQHRGLHLRLPVRVRAAAVRARRRARARWPRPWPGSCCSRSGQLRAARDQARQRHERGVRHRPRSARVPEIAAVAVLACVEISDIGSTGAPRAL